MAPLLPLLLPTVVDLLEEVRRYLLLPPAVSLKISSGSRILSSASSRIIPLRFESITLIGTNEWFAINVVVASWVQSSQNEVQCTALTHTASKFGACSYIYIQMRSFATTLDSLLR